MEIEIIVAIIAGSATVLAAIIAGIFALIAKKSKISLQKHYITASIKYQYRTPHFTAISPPYFRGVNKRFCQTKD